MPDDNTPITTPTPIDSKSSFSLEYVQELRSENAAYRTKAKEADAKAQTAQAKALEVQQASDLRVIRAELKAEAIKAGMVDVDGLKLADLSQVSLNEHGDVIGAADMMKSLKVAKPYLFGSVASTSQSAPAPGKSEAKAFHARSATPEELAADAKARGLNIRVH